MGRGACVPGARCAGQRATGCAREAVKVNAMIYAFTRPEQRTWMGNILLPAGAPCEARGSAACATAALFWVLFWCQKSTAAQLFGFAPSGALLSHADGTCEDKQYPNAVSIIPCEAKEMPTYLVSVRKSRTANRPRYPFPCAANGRKSETRISKWKKLFGKARPCWGLCRLRW